VAKTPIHFSQTNEVMMLRWHFFNIMLWTWTASEVLVLLLTRTRSGEGEVQDRGTLRILWPVIGASVTLATWRDGSVTPHNLFGGSNWVGIAGLVLFVIGLAVRWSAITTLGRFFSANVAIRPEQAVEKRGLYRFVRHPSYSGMLLIFAAIGLCTRNWLDLAIMLIPTTAALLYRIHVEEAALHQAFGREYGEYCRSTKRLIPGIY
jgi:protein-S-isoprenylcysteine O-methyltransferase Ste14